MRFVDLRDGCQLIIETCIYRHTPTERRNFDKIVNLIIEESQKLGLTAEKVVDKNGTPHVMVTIPKAPMKAKKVVFITHYDVVPAGDGWDFDQRV